MADRLHLEVSDFLRNGRCSRRNADPTLFGRWFRVLEAGTHGDLHSSNVLALDGQESVQPFVIDFSEFQEKGHPFYDYARLENDIRLRLMGCEDSSDLMDNTLSSWLEQEKRLEAVLERHGSWGDGALVSTGTFGFIDKATDSYREFAYWRMGICRKA